MSRRAQLLPPELALRRRRWSDVLRACDAKKFSGATKRFGRQSRQQPTLSERLNNCARALDKEQRARELAERDGAGC